MKKVTSFISQKNVLAAQAIQGKDINNKILSLIQRDFPNFTSSDFISFTELSQYRKAYISQLLIDDDSALSYIHQEVFAAFQANESISYPSQTINNKYTLGQKIADKVANFGGSWTFIICFFCFILVWMAFNVWILANNAYDPYPFILLNLILSCLAAIQAPIIMMSQNRQEEKDRKRSEQDFKINLKAELEIQLLHEKIDHILIQQHKKYLEFQEMQLEYLDQIIKQSNHSTK